MEQFEHYHGGQSNTIKNLIITLSVASIAALPVPVRLDQIPKEEYTFQQAKAYKTRKVEIRAMENQ